MAKICEPRSFDHFSECAKRAPNERMKWFFSFFLYFFLCPLSLSLCVYKSAILYKLRLAFFLELCTVSNFFNVVLPFGFPVSYTPDVADIFSQPLLLILPCIRFWSPSFLLIRFYTPRDPFFHFSFHQFFLLYLFSYHWCCHHCY